MMFNFFSKPVGIYIRENRITLAQVEKVKGGVELKKVIQKELPAGAILNFEVIDPKFLLPLLKALHTEVGSTECVLALPVSKTYVGLLRFPSELTGESLEEAVKGQLERLMPLPLEELLLETSVFIDSKTGVNLVLVVGTEKKIFDSLKDIFIMAGFTRPLFVLESLALRMAMTLKKEQMKNTILVHSFGDTSLISGIFAGRCVDGRYSRDLKKDFVKLYQAYVQMTGLAPSHVVTSGDKKSLTPLSAMKFTGVQPNFMEGHFVGLGKYDVETSQDLVMATGLALSMDHCDKKSGRCLINLLD